MKQLQIKYKRPKKTIVINNTDDTIKVLKKVFSKNTIDWKEQVVVLCINSSSQYLGYKIIHQGGLTSSLIDLRVLFQVVLLSNATKFIIAHNHPSGNINASTCDLKMNREVKKAADIMHLQFLDNIIVTREKIRSIIHLK